jgi:prepilin-type N-terminal cleavage/methylation domain-containing protein
MQRPHTHLGVAGFTLIELLVALAVVGVAASVFIALFNASTDMARTSRNRAIAIQLGEAQLETIVQRPTDFLWDYAAKDSAGRIPIRLSPDDPKAGNSFATPAAMPAEPSAFERESNTFSAFRWRAFAEQGSDTAIYTVTVVVRWREAQREQSLAFTTALPASSAPKEKGA